MGIRIRDIKIGTRLYIYILTLTIVIFGSIALVFHTYSRQREERQAVRYTTVLMENLLQGIEQDLSEVENVVALTRSNVVRDLHRPDSMMHIVSRMVKLDSIMMGGCVAFEPDFYANRGRYFMEYASADTAGNIKMRHLGSDTYDYHKMEWYAKCIRLNQGIWSDPYFDTGGGETLMITYSLPIHNETNQTVGVVTADVSLDELTQEVDLLRPYKDSFSFIVDRDGRFLTHPDKDNLINKSIYDRASELGCPELGDIGSEMLTSKSGYKHFEYQGQDYLICYTRMREYDWTVVSLTPYKSIMSELGSMALTVLLILLVGMILMVVFTRLFVVRITRPIHQLTGVAYHIANGNFDAALPTVDRGYEAEKLRDAFLFMQSSLKKYIEQLTITTKAKERIESELNIARRIQSSLIPRVFPPFPACEKIEAYGMLRPAREVGGDFFDYMVSNDRLFFAIGDVSGKGAPAALMMAIVRTLFRIVAKDADSPGQIVTMLNKAISENNDENMFVTMYVGMFDLKYDILHYCNAGHNPPIVITSDGYCCFQKVKANIPIGIDADFQFVEQKEFPSNNTSLFLYTDGLTEAENSRHELFDDYRLTKVLRDNNKLSPQELIEMMDKEVVGFAADTPQSDDLTMFCLKYLDTRGELKFWEHQDLTLYNEPGQLEQLPDFIRESFEHWHLPQTRMSSLLLAVEEAVANAINYAYPPGEKGEICVDLEWIEDERILLTTIIDLGTPFNPLAVEEPDITLPLEERPIGGLGIHLIRNLMDQVDYHYRDDMNLLQMRLHIPASTTQKI
ncbi:MAG: SpoIIE family protein phosphatase [Lepagella sp.]